MVRGSPLSKSCMQGQPSDAASGGLGTLGKTCLQGGNDIVLGSSLKVRRPRLDWVRVD